MDSQTQADQAPATRICKKCGMEKPLEQFPANANRKYGRDHTCKSCAAANGRRWYAANAEKVAEERRRYREAHPEKLAEQKRRYREANREKLAESHRRYREANREKLAESHRRYREANPEKVAESYRRWSAANAEKVRSDDANRRANLSDDYIKKLLAIPYSQITQEMMDLKRIQLATGRAAKELITAINQLGEPHETV